MKKREEVILSGVEHIDIDQFCLWRLSPYTRRDMWNGNGYSLFTVHCSLAQRYSGGYCGGVPPLPIPNREVKPACADGTAMQCGRVGGRHFSKREPFHQQWWEGFFLFSCTLPARTRRICARITTFRADFLFSSDIYSNFAAPYGKVVRHTYWENGALRFYLVIWNLRNFKNDQEGERQLLTQ